MLSLFVHMFEDITSVEYFHEVYGISKAITAGVGDEFTLILINDRKMFGYGSNSVG